MFSRISLFLSFYELNIKKCRLKAFSFFLVKVYFSLPIFVCQSGIAMKHLVTGMNTDYQAKEKRRGKKSLSVFLSLWKLEMILKDTEWQKKKKRKLK